MKYINKQFVRWDDLDAFGHVNNAKYLTFVQEARFLWATEEYSAAMRESSLIEMVVARAEIDFVEPIYDGGRFVDIEVTIEKIGNSSFNMHFVISDGGKVFAHVRNRVLHWICWFYIRNLGRDFQESSVDVDRNLSCRRSICGGIPSKICGNRFSNR